MAKQSSKKAAAKKISAKKSAVKKSAAKKVAAKKSAAAAGSKRGGFHLTEGLPHLALPTERSQSTSLEGLTFKPAKEKKETRLATPIVPMLEVAAAEIPESEPLDVAVQERLLKAIAKATSRLLKFPDVVSVGYGFKVSGGVVTNQPAIVVSVRQKFDDESLIPAKRLLPKEIEGFPVDIVAHPRPQAVTVFGGGKGVNTNSSANPTMAGTLGAIAFDQATGLACAISNVHVWGSTLKADVFWPAANPASATPIGKVVRTAPQVDACLCLINGNVANFTRTISGLGFPIAGITNPFVGQIVEKSGATTGPTYGRVGQTFGGGYFSIDPVPGGPSAVSLGGDSGSVWIERGTHMAVGLHFGGNGVSGAMHPMDAVASSLKIKF